VVNSDHSLLYQNFMNSAWHLLNSATKSLPKENRLCCSKCPRYC